MSSAGAPEESTGQPSGTADATMPAGSGSISKIRLADHPRAAHSIVMVRAWATTITFVLSMFLGAQAGVPFVELVARSILIGAAAYVVAWFGAQAVWRQVMYAEVAAARRRAQEQREALLAEVDTLAGNQPPAPREH